MKVRSASKKEENNGNEVHILKELLVRVIFSELITIIFTFVRDAWRRTVSLNRCRREVARNGDNSSDIGDNLLCSNQTQNTA